MEDWAIDLKNVVKVYKGKVRALQGIEMRVRRGEVFGLLGPNGAGKSTLVKIMMTVIRPTRAEGAILGHPVGHKPTLRRVGYLPEQHRFPRYLTGRQTLDFFGALSKVDRPARKRRAGELLELVGMTDWADKKVSTYSKGMMQRVGLAQAMMSDPDLIVLDEPTDGVDPVGRRDIRDVLLRLRDQGKTVFVNSHLLQELEMICERVAILVRGQVVKQGTIDELTRAQQRYDVELAVNDTAEAVALRPRLLEVLTQLGATLTEQAPAPVAQAAPVAPVPAGAPAPTWPPHFSASARTAAWNAPSPPTGPMPVGYAGFGPVAGPTGPHASVPRYARDAGTLASGHWVEVEGPWVRVGTTEPREVQPILDALRAAGLVIRRLNPMRQSLESLFMEAVLDPVSGRALAPGAARPGGPLPVAPAAALPQPPPGGRAGMA